MTEKEAINYVYKFLDSNNYTGERILLIAEKFKTTIDVQMLKPYGLFIVKNDGTVLDNYRVFEEE
uniref:Uncharacterized protein n=1 Tax=viral metagenome TaxID=1070528 RepID=A0A6M3X4K2_9ZZZZ